MKAVQPDYSHKPFEDDVSTSKSDTKPKKPRKFWQKEYYVTLKRYFGLKYVLFMVDSYFSLKGGSSETMYQTLLPYAQHLKYDSASYQRLLQAKQLAWSIKGIFGVVSDTFPLFGFHKLSYILVTLCLSVTALTILATAPIEFMKTQIIVLCGCVFLSDLTSSITDLCCEGKYTAIMTEYPETRGDVVSLVMFTTFAGRLFVASYLGVLIDNYGVYPVLWIAVFYVGHVIVLCLFNVFDEKRVAKHLRNRINWEKAKKMKSYATLAVVSSLIPVIVSLYHPPSSLTRFLMVLGVYSLAMITSYCLLPRKYSHTNFYNFLDGLTPSYAGAVDYWYTAGHKCVPGGPHFSMTYYRTISSLGSLGAQLVGVLIFQSYLSTARYKTVNFSTNILIGITQLVDVIILLRWNVKYLKINDAVFFFLGDAVLQPALATLRFLVGFIILSRLCPKTMECTVFAILAGFSNFAGVVSYAFGNVILERYAVSLGDDYCSYDNLPMIKFITAVVSSIALAIIQNMVLPDRRMSDVFTEEEIYAKDFAIDIYLAWIGNKLKGLLKCFKSPKQKHTKMITDS